MSDSVKTGRQSVLGKSSQSRTTPTEVRKEANNLESLVDSVANYTPTDAQRRAKSRLLVSLDDNPMLSLDSITLEQASQLGGYSFKKYWNEPGFQQWLTNSAEFKQRVEYLAHLCMDKAEDILRQEDPKLASAQVSLIGKVAEIANKMPRSSGSGKGMTPDDKFSSMNMEQLQEWMSNNVALPAKQQVIEGEVLED